MTASRIAPSWTIHWRHAPPAAAGCAGGSGGTAAAGPLSRLILISPLVPLRGRGGCVGGAAGGGTDAIFSAGAGTE
ncbi:MAG: hypothetical protein ACYTGM_18485 [Planctomycetota bacterium]|jgi:hypothetical protein